MQVNITPPEDVCAGVVPSFTQDVQPVLSHTCAKAGCHDGISMPCNFSDYQQLLSVLDDSSFYYYVIKDRTMPQDSALSAAQYKILQCWLANGHPGR